MQQQGRFYWLKLKRDFFKKHKMVILEAMPNGKEYSLFYLKLMLESLDHEGRLRFNDQIPYDENMLAAVTNTNIDVVRSAIRVLQQLELLEILDDQTIYMTEVSRLIGSAVDSPEANRQRRCREQKQLALQNVTQSVTKCNESIEYKSIDKKENSISKEDRVKEKDQSTSDFTPAQEEKKTVKHKFGKFENVLLTDEEHQKLLALEEGQEAIDFMSEYRAYKGYKAKSDYLAIKKWVFDALKEQKRKQERLNSGYTTKASRDFNSCDREQTDDSHLIGDAELDEVRM